MALKKGDIFFLAMTKMEEEEIMQLKKFGAG
jgi:hypothetical protein